MKLSSGTKNVKRDCILCIAGLLCLAIVYGAPNSGGPSGGSAQYDHALLGLILIPTGIILGLYGGLNLLAAGLETLLRKTRK